jgi:hypothetical protein
LYSLARDKNGKGNRYIGLGIERGMLEQGQVGAFRIARGPRREML